MLRQAAGCQDVRIIWAGGGATLPVLLRIRPAYLVSLSLSHTGVLRGTRVITGFPPGQFGNTF